MKPPDTVPVILGCLFANFVLRMHTNSYFSAYDQNSDVAIRFSDPDLLKIATIWRSDVVFTL